VSERYPDTMVPGGMVFLRVNPDHHGVALVGGATKSERTSPNHFAFEVGSLDEVFRARVAARAERAHVGSRAGAVRKAPVSSPRPFGRVEDWRGIGRLPLAVSAVSSSMPF
jgi:hypothetical protein